MRKESVASAVVPNLFELDEQPFLKREAAQWKRFKDKEKFLPLFRGVTYQAQAVLAKIFLFDIREETKDKRITRELVLLTEKEVIGLQQLYQILNQSMAQHEFSDEVGRLKQFQAQLRRYVQATLHRNYITFKAGEEFLVFNVYRVGQEYCIKATFSSFNYKFQLPEESELRTVPEPFFLRNPIIVAELNKRFQSLLALSNSVKLGEELPKLYKNFYDQTYFHYDEFMLRLQVFQNYPLLRLKNFIPIRFMDSRTEQPLEGPIFSNADPECMFQHFVGFNADTTRGLEGDCCGICQLPYEQFQENDLMMMLRDNICNPERNDVFYCPEFNRFKLLGRIPIQGSLYQTTIKYLNYYHFRINLKKTTGKHRLTFYYTTPEESSPLSFKLNGREHLIMDPARGKYCQHYSFTDLRLYYQSYDPQTRLYNCPIPGCGQSMSDGDILYLREVQILLKYAVFKCEKQPQLVTASQILINHIQKKVFMIYKAREEGSPVPLSKMDEIPDFFKTLSDPFVPFAEYCLGIKDKQRQQKMNDYMFGGWREQMQQQIEQQQQQDD